MMRRKTLGIALALCALSIAACDGSSGATKGATTADSTAGDSLRGADSGGRALAPIDSVAALLGSAPQTKQTPAAAAPVDSGPPFRRMAGYVVRGTDESSFRACGSNRTHLLRPRGEATAIILQRYRFKAPTPLSPVYFVFREARVLEDTAVVGDNTYFSVVEVRAVEPEVAGAEPECPAPGRGSMIAR